MTVRTRGTTWYLYRVRCLIAGVGDYFGITTRPIERESEHRRGKNKAKIHAAIKLYGEGNFTFEIVASFLNELDARIAEFDYIARFNTGWPNGLNVLSTGKGVYSHESYRETYKKRSEARKKSISEKHRSASSARMKAWCAIPENKKRLRSRAKEYFKDPEHLAKASEYARLAKHPEQERKAQSERMKQWWQSGVFRNTRGRKASDISLSERDASSVRTKMYFSDPSKKKAFCQKLKEAWDSPAGEERRKRLKARWDDPEYKKRNTSAMHAARPDFSSAEMRKKFSAGQLRRHARERAERALHDGKTEGEA